jgi:class 3 adenylate cyclase/CHASE2 domain-containing sensor protein
LCCSGFFVLLGAVKLKPFKHVPGLVALVVIALVCLVRVVGWDWAERQERMTFDMRVRKALLFSPPVATNLGFIFIDEESVKQVANGSLGFRFGREWPRQVYGRLIRELSEQGAKAVALDIILGELRPDHGIVLLADGTPGPESDEFFAVEMRRAGNVILARTPEISVPPWFLTNAAALGDIAVDKDRPEGILRRAKAFRMYRKWHPAFLQLEADARYGVDLSTARIEARQIVLPRKGLPDMKVPLDEQGNFDVADFWGEKLPPGIVRRDRPFTEERVWHMGIVLAARELNLDLAKPGLDQPHRRITLRGPSVERVIPVDADGYFYIDWAIGANHPRLTQEPIQTLLAQYRLRLLGQTNELVNRWRGKLAVVGSAALVGNNLTDRGATPTSADSLLVGEYWNVANSILTGRFIERSPLGLDLSIIAVLGMVAAFITWRVRVLLAPGLILVVLLAYTSLAVTVYIQTRYWLPLFLPICGAILMMHVAVVTWRVLFEQAARRRVRSIFSTIVSPKIVNELLKAETLSLVGARREVTILFADVRGFTKLTDASQEQAAEYVRREKLSGAEAEACFDQQARETLETVNRYLGLIADILIQNDGTLDKFIGDCVMAFWGAPTSNPRHALCCVRAAIQAQRAVYELNRERALENQKRELENRQRIAAGQPPRSMLPILFLGTGINTGMATVGLMGSATKGVVRQGNYTVFGREVNLASRLESASGRGHIYIGPVTYQHLLNHDPTLAATCVALPAQEFKGIAHAVAAYEAPWQNPGAPPLEQEFALATGSKGTDFNAFMRS